MRLRILPPTQFTSSPNTRLYKPDVTKVGIATTSLAACGSFLRGRLLFGPCVVRHSQAAIISSMRSHPATKNGRRERMLASPRFNGRVFQTTYPVSTGLKPTWRWEIGASHPSWGRHSHGPRQRSERVRASRKRGVLAHSLGDVQSRDSPMERARGDSRATRQVGRCAADDAEARRAGRTCAVVWRRPVVACCFECRARATRQVGRSVKPRAGRTDAGLTHPGHEQ